MNIMLIKPIFFTIFIILFPAALFAADMEITSFRTTNQSPLVMIQAIPSDSSSLLTPKGRFASAFTFDLSSEYSSSISSSESILFDGEFYRWTVSARYGLTDKIEVGFELPFVIYGGGFLDSFLIGWHDVFGMPQGGRDTATKNRVLFNYINSGQQRLLMKTSGSGFGDIVLAGGMKLYEEKSSAVHDTVALRSTIKLPTGDSHALLGNGAFGGTLSLCWAVNRFTERGSLGVFGSAGGMLSGDGKVLKEQQEDVAAFGSLGLGWGPSSLISFKVQLNANTRLYSGSSLAELSRPALMLVSGGALKLPDDYQLDLGVSEDVSVGTAPDVAFHFGLSKVF